ncbi:hypothetical protein ADUPG1_007841 [Aduncisulcus paluster]|uniref:Uncharacterized protein n=1 Tax=Aduncisulcus paluster TaxID=2918883 RepID=A0ABQ5KPT2_9EUKA|nr:hypothetical protein ADUPG1_007841 [Aduncisulcus paluster]
MGNIQASFPDSPFVRVDSRVVVPEFAKSLVDGKDDTTSKQNIRKFIECEYFIAFNSLSLLFDHPYSFESIQFASACTNRPTQLSFVFSTSSGKEIKRICSMKRVSDTLPGNLIYLSTAVSHSASDVIHAQFLKEGDCKHPLIPYLSPQIIQPFDFGGIFAHDSTLKDLVESVEKGKMVKWFSISFSLPPLSHVDCIDICVGWNRPIEMEVSCCTVSDCVVTKIVHISRQSGWFKIEIGIKNVVRCELRCLKSQEGLLWGKTNAIQVIAHESEM